MSESLLSPASLLVILGFFTLNVLLLILLSTFLIHKFRLSPSRDIRSSWQGAIIGHRGYRGGYNIPENSFAAFQYAYEHGCDGIEVDVMLTADKEIVVMHDGKVDRTMEGKGEVNHLTLKQIQAMRYKRVTNEEYEFKEKDWESRLGLKEGESADTAPTLKQIIQFAKQRNLKLMVELKEWRDPALIRSQLVSLFDEHSMSSFAYIASFNPLHLYMLRLFRPDIPTCFLYCRDCLQWYHNEFSHEMELPYLINNRFTRLIVDRILEGYGCAIGRWLGVAIVGPQDILVSESLIVRICSEGQMACDIWCVNKNGQKQWLTEFKQEGVFITTDRLFHKNDVLDNPHGTT